MIEKALIRNCILAERDFGIKSNEYTNAKNALSEYQQKTFEENIEKPLFTNMLNDFIENKPLIMVKSLLSSYIEVLEQRME